MGCLLYTSCDLAARKGAEFEICDPGLGVWVNDVNIIWNEKEDVYKRQVYNSRMFCTRWNGLEKGSIFDDALDDKEYEGNLIYLLKSGSEFIRNNSKVRFVKEAQYRVDKPD